MEDSQKGSNDKLKRCTLKGSRDMVPGDRPLESVMAVCNDPNNPIQLDFSYKEAYRPPPSPSIPPIEMDVITKYLEEYEELFPLLQDDPAPGEVHQFSLEAVPKEFYSPTFNLADPVTFEKVCSEAPNSHILLHERLSHHLDQVELALLHQIQRRSRSFFSALTNMQELSTEVSGTCASIASQRCRVQSMRDNLVRNALRIALHNRRRNNLARVQHMLQLMASVQEAQPTIQLLLDNKDFATALELINRTQDILQNSLGGVQAFRYMPKQLENMTVVIEKMITKDFVSALLHWNTVALAAAESGEGIKEEAATEQEEREQRLRPLVLALHRRHMLASAMAAYRSTAPAALKDSFYAVLEASVATAAPDSGEVGGGNNRQKKTLALEAKVRQLSDRKFLAVLHAVCSGVRAQLRSICAMHNVVVAVSDEVSSAVGARTLGMKNGEEGEKEEEEEDDNGKDEGDRGGHENTGEGRVQSQHETKNENSGDTEEEEQSSKTACTTDHSSSTAGDSNTSSAGATSSEADQGRRAQKKRKTWKRDKRRDESRGHRGEPASSAPAGASGTVSSQLFGALNLREDVSSFFASSMDTVFGRKAPEAQEQRSRTAKARHREAKKKKKKQREKQQRRREEGQHEATRRPRTRSAVSAPSMSPTHARASASSMRAHSSHTQTTREACDQMLVVACEQLHHHCSALLKYRRESNSKMQLSDFVELHSLCTLFIDDCEDLIEGAHKCYSLRGVLSSQMKRFVAAFHNVRLSSMALILESETWTRADVAIEFQQIADQVFGADRQKAQTHQQMESTEKGGRRGKGEGVEAAPREKRGMPMAKDHEEEKGLHQVNDGAQPTPEGPGKKKQNGKEEAIAQAKKEKDGNKLTDKAEAAETPPAVHKALMVEGQQVHVANAALLLLKTVQEYLVCIRSLPAAGTDILQKVVELLQLFNSRTCGLVLGAGAMQVARLKRITAKHLALACQCVSLVVSLIPHIQEGLRFHLAPKHHMFLEDLDRVKRDCIAHREEIFSKLVQIMQERVEAHSRAMLRTNLNEPGAEGPSSYVLSLAKETTTLNRVLSQILPPGDVEVIFSRIFEMMNTRLTHHFAALDGLSSTGRKRLHGDIEYLVQQLRALSGLKADPGDALVLFFTSRFGAV